MEPDEILWRRTSSLAGRSDLHVNRMVMDYVFNVAGLDELGNSKGHHDFSLFSKGP